MTTGHIPVLLKEVLEYIRPDSGGIYIDGTLGLGGHSEEILRRSAPDGKLIGIDRDLDALEAARERLVGFNKRVTLVHGNFADMKDLVSPLGIKQVDGILLDLGVSSPQLDRAERGFSFLKDAPLDMRMDRSRGITAADVVNDYPEDDLMRIIREFGEERYSRPIAGRIVKARKLSRIRSTVELAGIVESAIPRKAWPRDIHPATRTFQALRIAVNDELRSLEKGLNSGIDLLRKGGRLCVISFHSLEDRIVKNTFRYWEMPCICPPEFPVCTCGKVKAAKVATKKAVKAAEDEVAANPRSRSARLRVAEKL